MSLLKKKNDNTEPQFSFGESILVLVGILCILGYLIIVKKQEPQAPLLYHLWYWHFTVTSEALNGKP